VVVRTNKIPSHHVGHEAKKLIKSSKCSARALAI
jgi:hypothetical protein